MIQEPFCALCVERRWFYARSENEVPRGTWSSSVAPAECAAFGYPGYPTKQYEAMANRRRVWRSIARVITFIAGGIIILVNPGR